MEFIELYPDFDEVKRLSSEYERIPLSFELLADFTTPMLLLRKIMAKSNRFFLLESVEGGEKWGRYSFLGFQPEKVLTVKNSNCTISSENSTENFVSVAVTAVRKISLDKNTLTFPHLPIFTGGAVGYFGYDTFFYTEEIEQKSKQTLDVPDCLMMQFDNIIAFDHQKQKLIVIMNIDVSNKNNSLNDIYEDVQNLALELKNFITAEYIPLPKKSVKKPEFKSNKSFEEFSQMVEKCKEYIKNGDIFQAVLSQRFEADYDSNLMTFYRALRTVNPSPYMYFMKCDDIEVAGASPETLVRVQDGEIFTFPIAGTRKRGLTDLLDKEIEQDLLSDPKEIAEHNMLVDLARNDVGKVAEIGSVNVKKYMDIQRYSHVMHITSEVRGKKLDNIDSLDVLSSILPAGTLSGAPKIRAAEIIDELEGENRGIYGGGLGYIAYSGNLDFAITIRTAVKLKNKVYVQSGGGIVLDSIPENEFEESISKAGAVMRAFEIAADIEG